MNDLKPFKHGEEGTHSACNKHNIGKSVCCECSGRGDCGDEAMTYTEKILAEFDEKFPRMFAGSAGQYNQNGDTRPYYNDNVKAFFATSIQQAVAEDRARVMEELDQQVMWYNLNNQIPESELSKGQEHWDMIRKAIKDSLQEVQSRIQNSLNKPTTL